MSEPLLDLPLLLPATVSYWPQTWPWAVVAALLVVLLLALARRCWRCYRRGRYRRAALAELAGGLHSAGTPAAGAGAAALNTLLKRTALAETAAAGWPRDELASLSGAAWWRYLDAALAEGETPFAALGEQWQTAIYTDSTAPLAPAEWQRWQAAARYWLRRHRTPSERRR